MTVQPDPMLRDGTSTILLWIAGAALVLAGVAYLVLRYVAVALVRRVAEATERRVAQSIGKGLAGRNLEFVRAVPDDVAEKYVAQIARITRVMDRLVPLPIVGGVGLDVVIGLVPVLGDAVSLAVSSLVIVRAAQLGVPRDLVIRIVAIHCTDLLLGAIPVVGDLVDVAYQANVRSSRLIQEFLARRDDRAPGGPAG